MRVLDLSGKSHAWNLSGYSVRNNDLRPRSDLHIAVRNFLKEEYPTEQILEEVPVPGEGLFLDFLVLSRKKVIEAHGKQHFEFNSFFYNSKADFLRAKGNDQRKREWCAINNLQLIEFVYSEGINEWRNKLYA